MKWQAILGALLWLLVLSLHSARLVAEAPHDEWYGCDTGTTIDNNQCLGKRAQEAGARIQSLVKRNIELFREAENKRKMNESFLVESFKKEQDGWSRMANAKCELEADFWWWQGTGSSNEKLRCRIRMDLEREEELKKYIEMLLHDPM